MRTISRISNRVKNLSQNLYNFITTSLNQVHQSLNSLLSSRKTKGAAMLSGAFLLVTPVVMAHNSNKGQSDNTSSNEESEVKAEETVFVQPSLVSESSTDLGQTTQPISNSSNTSSTSQTTVTTNVSSTVNGETTSQQQTYTSSSNNGGSSSQVTVSVSGDAGTEVEFTSDNESEVEFEHESNSRTEYDD